MILIQGAMTSEIGLLVENLEEKELCRTQIRVKVDTDITAKYKKGESKYLGKKFSIIGDSISTYQDYIPKGYPCFYPYPTADVYDVNMTWWMMTINRLGGGLFINNSYSGSCPNIVDASAP